MAEAERRHNDLKSSSITKSTTASRLITLNDPPANTYSYEMMQQLDRAILEARMDEACR
jgi:enoyl-CoA hydratase/carnithine racemase